jgi:N-acetylglucosaminyldiphosphoundecaprenol N-acetyl-beta-D-mannosaminyltransferase
MRDVIQLIERWITLEARHPKPHQIIVSGFHGIWEAYQDPDLKTVFNSADAWIPDGIAPVFLARLKGFRHMDRTPGAELMKAFFQIADKKGYRSFFYGDTDKTLAGLKKKLRSDYPGHQIAGTYSPPFRPLTDREDEDIIRMINDARPDILWVALGLPKQERWIYERKDRLKVPVVIGVGAAFAFISGDVKRVPKWIGENGLEWLWRFIQEPKKLWRRDLIDGPRFLWSVLLEIAKGKKTSEDENVSP